MEIPTIVGAGLIVIGAGLGIGKIGGSAMAVSYTHLTLPTTPYV